MHKIFLLAIKEDQYLEKTKDIGDPYSYKSAIRLVIMTYHAPVRTPDIFDNYLVLSTSFCTSDRFKGYKSLDSYKYFISSFVNSVAGEQWENILLLLGRYSCAHRHNVTIKYSYV